MSGNATTNSNKIMPLLILSNIIHHKGCHFLLSEFLQWSRTTSFVETDKRNINVKLFTEYSSVKMTTCPSVNIHFTKCFEDKLVLSEEPLGTGPKGTRAAIVCWTPSHGRLW